MQDDSSVLNPKQKSAARMLAFRDAKTTKENIAASVGTSGRNLRRWEAIPGFQAEIDRIQDTETQLGLDEAWRRLGINDRILLAKRARKETGLGDGIDIDGELESILGKVTDFSSHKPTDVRNAEWVEKSLEDAASRIGMLGNRVRCIVTGENPGREPNLETLQIRLDSLKVLRTRRKNPDKYDEYGSHRESENWADSTIGPEEDRIGSETDDDEDIRPIDDMDTLDERMMGV